VGFTSSGDKPDDVDEHTKRLLHSICSRTLKRSERQSETDWTRLSANCQLVDDDHLNSPFQVSTTAAGGIAVATESQHGVAIQLLSSLTYSTVPFILAKVTIESAANVVWMLSPASSVERARRCLVITRLEVSDAYKLVKPIGLHPPDELLAQIGEIARRAHGDVAQKLDDRAHTTSTARVREAARFLGKSPTACSPGWSARILRTADRPNSSDAASSTPSSGHVARRHHAHPRFAPLPRAWSRSTRGHLKRDK
jgi:hypothetical protein